MGADEDAVVDVGGTAVVPGSSVVEVIDPGSYLHRRLTPIRVSPAARCAVHEQRRVLGDPSAE